MSQLVADLTDLDLVTVGLAGNWNAVPDWLLDALTRCLARDNTALVHSCRANEQTGVLETIVKRGGLWGKTPRSIRTALASSNMAIRILGDTLRTAASEIDYVCGELGIVPIYLKGTVTSLKYYEHPWQRMFHDVDVLVPEEQALRVFDILKKMGYIQGSYDSKLGEILRDDSDPRLSTHRGYELPRLTRMIPVSCDNKAKQLLRAYDGPYLRLSDDTVWVAASVEIHFALEPDRRIRWQSEPTRLESLPHGHCLDPETQLVFTCFKAYIDIIIFHNRAAIKLISDALRIIEKERSRIQWKDIVPRWHDSGVCAPLRYVFFHAMHTYQVPMDLSLIGSCSCSRGDAVPLDLGDFLPALTKGNRSFRIKHTTVERDDSTLV